MWLYGCIFEHYVPMCICWSHNRYPLWLYRCTGKKVFNEWACITKSILMCLCSLTLWKNIIIRYSHLVGLLYWKALMMANSIFMGIYTSVSSLGNNTQGSGVNFINCKLGRIRSRWQLMCVHCTCVCVYHPHSYYYNFMFS